jgi:hypothetical protein
MDGSSKQSECSICLADFGGVALAPLRVGRNGYGYKIASCQGAAEGLSRAIYLERMNDWWREVCEENLREFT